MGTLGTGPQLADSRVEGKGECQFEAQKDNALDLKYTLALHCKSIKRIFEILLSASSPSIPLPSHPLDQSRRHGTTVSFTTSHHPHPTRDDSFLFQGQSPSTRKDGSQIRYRRTAGRRPRDLVEEEEGQREDQGGKVGQGR
jgi:hypothetical protein